MIPEEELVEGEWYEGEGRTNHVAIWARGNFYTFDPKWPEEVRVKVEGYYGPEIGTFKPFRIIKEWQIRVADKRYILEVDLLEQALKKIVACDCRGNMPTEQSVAKTALDRLAEMRQQPEHEIETA